MANTLLQKYREVAKALVPYIPDEADSSGQMALITISPALPCFLCGQPAATALIAPAREYKVSANTPWLTFPLCPACQERQVPGQSAEET